LETLKNAGFQIIIHTCRTASYWKGLIPNNQPKINDGFMKYHKLPYDTLWIPDKPIGVAYIIKRYDLTIIGKISQKLSKITQKRQKGNITTPKLFTPIKIHELKI